jgi:hypothetical protein
MGWGVCPVLDRRSGIFLALDYFGADDSVRIETLVLLGTITLVKAIWRAAGALGARIELIMTRQATNNLVGKSEVVQSKGHSSE